MCGSLTRLATRLDRSKVAVSWKLASRLTRSPYVCSSTETGACGLERIRGGFAERLRSSNRKGQVWISCGLAKACPANGSIRLWRTAKAIYGLVQRPDWIVFARTKYSPTPTVRV